MAMRLTASAMAIGIAVSLVACNTSMAPRPILAQNTALELGSDVVRASENCPTSDDGGFGADVRHFGNATPWSENPFRNPCWPN